MFVNELEYRRVLDELMYSLRDLQREVRLVVVCLDLTLHHFINEGLGVIH